MMQTPGGRIVLFDWDGVGRGPRVAALGVLLCSCAVRAPFGEPEAPDISRVEHIVRGYARHATLSPPEQARLADAVRYRPLVVAARSFLESVEQGKAAEGDPWHAAYGRADEVAERVVAALARPAQDCPL
jgi:Ser/Thr protein kinase RdoA (MazF antagonist)